MLLTLLNFLKSLLLLQRSKGEIASTFQNSLISLSLRISKQKPLAICFANWSTLQIWRHTGQQITTLHINHEENWTIISSICNERGCKQCKVRFVSLCPWLGAVTLLPCTKLKQKRQLKQSTEQTHLQLHNSSAVRILFSYSFGVMVPGLTAPLIPADL